MNSFVLSGKHEEFCTFWWAWRVLYLLVGMKSLHFLINVKNLYDWEIKLEKEDKKENVNFTFNFTIKINIKTLVY